METTPHGPSSGRIESTTSDPTSQAIRRLYPIWTYQDIARVMRAGGRPAGLGGLIVIDGGRCHD